MPVPVPLCTKQPAHLVVKNSAQSRHSEYPSIFQNLTHSLPVPPSGPPPSFATREEWISSLPSWRRNKPRRIWEEDNFASRATGTQRCGRQGFEEGLTVAGNAPVIKGEHAQACIPPVSTLIASAGLDTTSPTANMYAFGDGDADDEMSESSPQAGVWQYDDEYDDSSSADARYEDVHMYMGHQVPVATIDTYGMGMAASHPAAPPAVDHYEEEYARGAFTPVFEDMSPEPAEYHDPASSPIGPSTPFTEFVDKAVASVDQDRTRQGVPQNAYNYHAEYCPPQCYQCRVDPTMQAAAMPEPVVTPSATSTYKRLAEPLSEWIASYVWKMCTTGLGLSSSYVQPSAFVKHYPSNPPSHLATSINSMLLSTLLQPSAIFLAIWYIKRLPIFFGPVNLLPGQRREMRFRAELLGEAYMNYDRDAVETYAPFRLVLLGCMLANKWLDDHTFSNKTWHSISNVPIQSLNRLESLALELFDYHMSITPQEWEDWLSYLTAYHLSLSSPAFPQPISRPSTSPHTIIRKALESLLQAKVTGHTCQQCDEDICSAGPPEPVFLGVEERKREEAERECVQENVDVLEIDLDEDGPLREEYLPRRRTSGAASTYRARESAIEAQRTLPPPARWSPAGDEPIFRDNARGHGQYVAPQPMATMLFPPLPPPLPFAQTLDTRGQTWSHGGYLPGQEPAGRIDYPSAAPAYPAPITYVGYEYVYPSHSHSRSQSLSYQQAISGQALPHNRLRSYSQTRFDYGYSDVRMSENHYPPALPPASAWSTLARPDIPSIHERPFEFLARPSVKV
ncbi:hypothetical protein OBBRIDRAFT_392435 [Obba rivulosa]|uniref:Cyclin N-terminal domain-containing protein n=1 Tax=Obba rivulosa TaxID=1052685 RepID=A0A8E2AYY7_9APHY|nr:hypothetical protein OBBRIDRAFT_392435 [Obba rivulosa]